MNNRVLTFTSGTDRQCFDVEIIEDNIDELDEEFSLILTTTDDDITFNRDNTGVIIEDVNG